MYYEQWDSEEDLKEDPEEDPEEDLEEGSEENNSRRIYVLLCNSCFIFYYAMYI